jgi:hypothetical protein
VEVWRDALGTGMVPRLIVEDVGNEVVPGEYDPTFCTCSLHLTSSIGVRTYDVNAPETPPATTSPVMVNLSDDCD